MNLCWGSIEPSRGFDRTFLGRPPISGYRFKFLLREKVYLQPPLVGCFGDSRCLKQRGIRIIKRTHTHTHTHRETEEKTRPKHEEDWHSHPPFDGSCLARGDRISATGSNSVSKSVLRSCGCFCLISGHKVGTRVAIGSCDPVSRRAPQQHLPTTHAPPSQKTHDPPPPLQRGFLWAWAFPSEITKKCQAPTKLAQPFPAAELRAEKLRT